MWLKIEQEGRPKAIAWVLLEQFMISMADIWCDQIAL